MAQTNVVINQDANNGTLEVQRLCGTKIIESKVISDCFTVCYNPSMDLEVFEISLGEEKFVIHYSEVDQNAFPTALDYYTYLKDLSDCSSSQAINPLGLKDGEFQVFCDPNDNDRLVAVALDLSDPLAPQVLLIYLDDSSIYSGDVNDLEPCQEKPSDIISDVQNPIVYSPSNANESFTLVAANPLRQRLVIQVLNAGAYIREIPASNTPSGLNKRKGLLFNQNGIYIIEANSNNELYRGEISVVNELDGQIPTFLVTESILA